ncbi:tyrosine-type recombinase/integrase [Amycolatopsis taiwanensis]|uniref:tyrosine-type recombinase/integrase n=1 Tax=Amycolatopsis taiwanensis TaxID=342230 RepID=UPI0012EBC4A3|nr:site-specific integrase [Amycolatopsis taiwanensis]
MAWVERSGKRSWRVRWHVPGRTQSVGGFRSEGDALAYVADMATDRRRGTWIDPAAGRITLAEWVTRWLPAIDLDERTVESYRSRLRCHLLPRFGNTPLAEITTLDVTLWATTLGERYAPTTISSLINLLSMILTDAADQHLIATNPVHKRRRRGRRSRRITREKIWATPEQVVHIAEQAGMLGGRVAYLLVITAAWTGCRWGELAGLHHSQLDLDHGVLTIDPFLGALHECGHRRWLGPPKRPSAARRITLPPFLVSLLREHMEIHPFEFVFTTPSGTWLWRSTFIRRVFRPAVDGKPGTDLTAVRRGLTFHGLRHSHKTWLIADAIPEIAQARRLGHRLDNRIVETYSHVAPEVEHRLLTALEHRWHTATHQDPPPAPEPSTPTEPPLAPVVPLFAGTRDTTTARRETQRAQRKHARASAGRARLMPQKRPTRGECGTALTIFRDHHENTRKPLRPARTA